MEYLNFITEMCASIIDSLFCYTFIISLLDFKEIEKKKRIRYTIYLITFLIFISCFTHNTYIFSLLSCVIFIIYAIFICRGSIKNKIFVPILFTALLIMVDAVNSLIFSQMFNFDFTFLIEPGTMARNLSLVISKLSLVPLMIVFLKIFSKKVFYNKSWIISVGFFLGVYAVTIITLYNGREEQYNRTQLISLIVVPSVLFVLSLVNAVCLYYMNLQYKYKLENELLNASVKCQKNSYKNIKNIYEQTQIMRHDTKHYYTALLGFLRDKKYDEAEQYIINILGDRTFNVVANYLSNPVLNGYLNYLQQQFEDNQIEFEMTISGEAPKDKENQLSIILFNVMDNAFNSSIKNNVRKIILDMHEYKGMYYIIVKNHIDSSIIEVNPELKTDQKASEGHGWGIKSVKKHVEELDGSYQVFEENGYFVCYISVPINNN